MLNEALTPREQRGLLLAATARITQRKWKFDVPSATNSGQTYLVVHVAGQFLCSCPDYELRNEPCKHCYAVQYFLKRETAPDGTVTETRSVRVTYPQQWAAYNRAQVTEKDAFCTLLRDLVADVPSPEQKRGRPALPLSDMLFSAAYKVYSTVSGRRFMTDLRDATAKGLIDRTPHYNSIFNVLDNEATTPILKSLITRSALPLKALETDFAVDSTGFGTQNFYRHYSAKYGRDQVRRAFVQLHAMVGCRTNVVTAAEATVGPSGDATTMPVLVAETTPHFNVEQVAPDKAYGSLTNLELLDGQGIKAMIPFKKNSTAASKNVGRSEVWARLFHFFSLHRDEFLASYHTRSNVESTFSAIKRKFSDQVRSRTPTAQINETLLKVLCHNIVCVVHEMNESGAIAASP
ncbi:MAG: transposase [Luteitalea sp.]|nr:transposase [Luteitalea sp.]